MTTVVVRHVLTVKSGVGRQYTMGPLAASTNGSLYELGVSDICGKWS